MTAMLALGAALAAGSLITLTIAALAADIGQGLGQLGGLMLLFGRIPRRCRRVVLGCRCFRGDPGALALVGGVLAGRRDRVIG
ncbi:hypothetical protein GZH49_33480 [Nocardia terpenica]|uniref:hypothetical protein n=1 Tax=Nocardia terpenica TaxID=455432 RepID=UPI002FE0497B